MQDVRCFYKRREAGKMKKILQDNILIKNYKESELFCQEYRKPFDGFTELQNAVLSNPEFWNQNQNLIIKGEPGSGKTLIAELAFLAVPSSNTSRIRKMLYLLPYRALLNEKYEYFLNGYNRSCFQIFRSSSDFYEDDKKILTGDCEIGIMIYEKLELAFRLEFNNRQLFYEYDLIVMDEFSIISTLDRGIIVNSILKQYLSLPKETNYRKKARIIALTVPECHTSEYLSMEFQAIKCEKKPVYIHEAIVQVDKGQIIPKDKDVSWPMEYENLTVAEVMDKKCEFAEKEELDTYRRNKELLLYLIKAHRKKGHNIIVFCSSRENSRNLCFGITKIVKDNHILHGSWKARLNKIKEQMGDNAYGCIDFLMFQSAEYGVTYHNADLPADLRREIEKEFRKKEGRLNIIVATETLAYGINCSADAVIIYDRIKPTITDDFPNFRYGGSYMRYLNSIEYKNYIGRAGRLGYADKRDINTGYAYLFSKDMSGTRRVARCYYAPFGMRFRSGSRLFVMKLKKRPLTATLMVFDQIQLDSNLCFAKKDILESVKFLAKKQNVIQNFLDENDIVQVFIDTLLKNEFIEKIEKNDQSTENERYMLTRLGKMVYGMHLPYESLSCFRDILNEVRKNGCTIFSLIYQFCKKNYDNHICSVNRQRESLLINIQTFSCLLETMQKNREVSEIIYRRVKKDIEWLKKQIDEKELKENGYINFSIEMFDTIYQLYDSFILYLWAKGISIESINIDYALSARYGSIKNQIRNITHKMDCLVRYLQSFMDIQDEADKAEEINQSVRHGMPYFCIEALGHQIPSQIRPEICELLSVTAREQCERILQDLQANCVTNTSSISEINSFRKSLEQIIEEIKND